MLSPSLRLLRAFLPLLAALLFGSALSAQSFTTYDLVVPVTSPSTPLFVDGTGRHMPANRSFIIGVEGGVRGALIFINWQAVNPQYPVIIVNKHGSGRVVVKDDGITFRDGIRFDNCAFVKLLGNNDPAHRYGFEVAQAGRMPSEGVSRISRLGINIGATSTNIEVGFVEVQRTGFAGIMAKTDPQLNRPDTWASNYTMHDLSIHNCYIHDVGGEGMYVGYTGWSTDHWADVPGFESHEIIGLRIFDNLIERTLWDGLQYASAPELTTEVFNNVVVTSGTQGEAGQSNGVQIGAGASGRFYDNVIIDSFGNNLAMFGRGFNAIYNNLLINGDNGVFTDNRPNPPPPASHPRQTIPGSYYAFYHNTIINPARHALWSMSEVTDTYFFNNLSVVPDPEGEDAFADPASGAVIHRGGNVLLRSLAAAGFADPARHDYRLLPPSPGVDAGAGLPAVLPPAVADLLGNLRPSGAAPDAGALESGPLSVHLLATPPATAGATGSVRAAVLGGTPPYQYRWSNGATVDELSGVFEGLYVVTVTDAAGAVRKRATYLVPGATMGAPVSVTPPHQVETPVAQPGSGSYAGPQVVTLTSATAGASFRYTVDGSLPTATHGIVYSGAFSVDYTQTVRAIALKPGLTPSAVETATYLISDGLVNTKLVPTAITASSSGTTAANVADGSLATNWSTTGLGQWIQFDLGAPQRVSQVNVAVASGTSRSYSFDVLTSTDGASWQPLLTGARTALDGALQAYDVTDAQPVRFVRLVAFGNTSVPTANAYAEIEVWGGAVATVVGPAPAAPASLAAQDGEGVVDLLWSTVPGATSYNVWRALSADGPFTVVAAGLTGLHHRDQAVQNRTTYFYRVTAHTLGGASAPSATASATPFGFPPAAPASLQATAGDGQLGLAWPAVAKASRYNVKRATSASGPFTVIASGLTKLTYLDFGLTNGVTQHYVVTAENDDGESAASPVAAATPQAGLGGIWHILTPLDWGQAGGGFCPATFAFDSQPVWNAQTLMPVGNDHEPHRSTLTEYTNRFWYVDFGADAASLRITQMWTRYRPNSAGTYNGFALMWWDDDRDNVNDGINAPTMNFAAGGTVANVNPQLWVRDRDLSAAPVTPLGRYLVVSTGPTVSGRPNEFAFVGFRDTFGAPATPAGVAASAAPANGQPHVRVTWSASPGATGYSVLRAQGGGALVALASGLTSLSYTDTTTLDGVTYRYAVTAQNGRGSSSLSAEAVATADATPPVLSLPAPLVLEATSAAGAVAQFTVGALDAVDGVVVATATPVSGSVFPLGLTTVQVEATDAAGNPATGSFTVTVQDTTAPVITSLAASRTVLWPANHVLVDVTLTAAVTEAVDPAPTTRIVTVSSNEPVDGEDDGNTTPDWVVTGPLTLQLRAERSGVGSGRVYRVTVESRDQAGNSSQRTVEVLVPVGAPR